MIETQPALQDAFATLPLNVLVASLSNPRKNFRADKLAELADSIKASGVHQPILVRSLPGDRVLETDREVQYEIVSGERRYRASVQAGLDTIPSMIRVLTDEQVFEIQIIENLQRDDLTELEEAEGYEHLMAHSKITAEDVGAKIGKSRSYVYGRLKLLDLSQECKDAMRAGQIDASRAILIARIPDAKLQLKALKEATDKDWQGETPSVRTFQAWLQRTVMLRLDQAKFKITDASLVDACGSCKDCPKRTGANPDLFADVQGADICTDPPCYQAKTDAHRSALIAKAEAKGIEVMSESDAKKVCSQYRSNLEGYTPVTQKRDDIDGSTLGKLLGKDAPAAVLIENPWTHELIEAVPTDEAEAVLLAKGLIKVTKAKQDAKAGLTDDIEELKTKAEREIDHEFREGAYLVLHDSIQATPDDQVAQLITPALLRAWWLSVISREELDMDDMAHMLNVTLSDSPNVPDEDFQLRLHVANCNSAELYRALLLFMITDDREGYFRFSTSSGRLKTHLFEACAKSFDADMEFIYTEAKAIVREETAQELSKLKADLKALAKPETTSIDRPAAQHKHVAGGAKNTRGPKPKISAKDAERGIAAAMQSDEAPSCGGAPLEPAKAWPFPRSAP